MPALDRLARWAAAPWAPWLGGALALLLSLPTLALPLTLDDHVLARRVAEGAPWWDLFSFVEPARVPDMMERGELGWWADPALRVRFLRPVASLTHWLDFTLWPGAPWLMHLWNALALAGTGVVAGILYRRWLGPTAVAGLAALLFAVDEAHGQAVGWVAARNGLLAAGLGFGALWAHDRWRRDGWRPGAALGPALLACALLAAEAGLATGGYLLAHALVLDRGCWRRRLGALWPYALVVVVWRVAYLHAGFGVTASGLYRDVEADPLGVAAAMVPTVCLLGFSELVVPVASFLGLTTRGWRLTAAGLAVVAWLLWPLLARDRLARFFALGLVLAALPFAATMATDRMLLPLGLGGAGLVARLLAVARAGILPARRIRPLARVMLVLHLGLAPVAFVPSALAVGLMERGVQRLLGAIPDRGRVLVVSVPLEVMLLWPRAIRQGRGEPWPDHVMVLHAGQATLVVERTGPRSLELQASAGWMPSPFNRLTRAPERTMPVGTRVELEAMTIEVLAVNGSGRPTRVAARFERPLEAMTWVAWEQGQPVAWRPPPPGERTTMTTRWEW